ncbi:MAG: LacI family transcriptional regulator [Paenibacillaceae bacterium]|jgi:LacI family transcriptional regulator|nr:LacI family transcriptional regulator [Paenibacillaceae bacterium]
MPRATLKDVAKKAEVSRTAASLILNGKPVRVSEETRRKVLKVAQELQYVPNALIRSLQTQRTSTIGIYFGVGGDSSNLYIGSLFNSIRREAENQGYDTLVYRTGNTQESLEASLFMDGRVDGLIYWSGRRPFNYEDLERSGLPVIVLLAPVEVAGLPALLFDDGSGMRLAMQHLLKLGHRNIAYLSGADAMPHLRYRQNLFTQTAASLAHENMTASVWSNANLEVKPLKDRLLEPERPTAIICAHDELSIRCAQVADEIGLSIPEQLSVISWEDPQPSFSRFTCIRQDVKELGIQAVRALVHRIRNPDILPIADTIIPVEFIMRSTTALPDMA